MPSTHASAQVRALSVDVAILGTTVGRFAKSGAGLRIARKQRIACIKLEDLARKQRIARSVQLLGSRESKESHVAKISRESKKTRGVCTSKESCKESCENRARRALDTSEITNSSLFDFNILNFESKYDASIFHRLVSDHLLQGVLDQKV